MTLAQLVETVFIRANPTTTENSKQVYRYEIEALIPGAILRLYHRLQAMGKTTKLLQTTAINCVNGVVSLPSTIISSSLEAGGDGYIFFADEDENQGQPISYEPIYENRYLKKCFPDLYYYSISPYSSGEKIQVYKGDGLATAPDGTVSLEVTALSLPTSANVSTLDPETTELLVESLIEILRERTREDVTPAFSPSNTAAKSFTSPQPI